MLLDPGAAARHGREFTAPPCYVLAGHSLRLRRPGLRAAALTTSDTSIARAPSAYARLSPSPPMNKRSPSIALRQ
jgi:hypothetical protein